MAAIDCGSAVEWTECEARRGQAAADGIETVVRAATGAAMMQTLAAAAELGILDALAGGPSDVDGLSQRLHCDRKSLRRLLRALASLGLCEECGRNVFAATDAASVLRAQHTPSLRHWVLWFARYLWPEWGQLAASVRSGRTARELSGKGSGMQHLEHDAPAAAIFDHAMGELTQLVAQSVAQHRAFEGARTIVDIGGGSGELLCAILQRHSVAHGVLLDRAHAIEHARERFAAAGLLHRCELVTGDFFCSVPRAADVYVLKSVVHDWDDERSAQILDRCREAMSAKGRVLLIEHLMPDRVTCSLEHQDIARRDLTMLIGPGGRERTEGEFRSLLERCGLACSSITRAALGFHVIEAESAARQPCTSARTSTESSPPTRWHSRRDSA